MSGFGWGHEGAGLGSVSALLGWTDVYSFATGADQTSITNGTGNNVTYAVTAAIAALPTHGGVLYFRPGRYVTTGGFTISKNCTILGFSNAAYEEAISPPGTKWVTQVECTTTNGVLFTITADYALVTGLALVLNGVTAVGAIGVKVTSSSYSQRVDFDNLLIDNFYFNVQILTGEQWTYTRVQNIRFAQSGIYIQNTVNPDAGDWSISDCSFDGQSGSGQAIEYVSSGGGKIVNVKCNTDAGASNHGILANLSALTNQLLISNFDAENCSQEPISITSGFGNITITNCYLKANVTGFAAINATNCSSIIISNNTLIGNASSTSAVILSNCPGGFVNGNTWSGFAGHVTDSSGTAYVGLSQDTAAMSTAQVAGTRAQKWSLYNTYTSTTNYERFTADWQAASNVLQLGTEKGASGTARNIHFIVGGTDIAELSTGGFTDLLHAAFGNNATINTITSYPGGGFTDPNYAVVISDAVSGNLANPEALIVYPTYAATSGSGAIIVGVDGAPAVTASSTAAIANLFGVTAFPVNFGTGLITQLAGVNGVATNSGGNITVMGGLAFAARQNSSVVGSTITTMYSVGVQQQYTKGAVTNGYGVFVNSASVGTGTVTNHYGVYIADQSGVGGTISENMHSFGAPSLNIFEGFIQQQAAQKRVSTQFNKVNNTLANITGLSVSVQAGRTYDFQAVLFTTSNVAAGVRTAIAGTCTATNIIYEAEVIDTSVLVVPGTTRANALATQVGDVTAVTAARIDIFGTITVANAGTLTVQFAQNVTNAGNQSSVLVGSYFLVDDQV